MTTDIKRVVYGGGCGFSLSHVASGGRSVDTKSDCNKWGWYRFIRSRNVFWNFPLKVSHIKPFILYICHKCETSVTYAIISIIWKTTHLRTFVSTDAITTRVLRTVKVTFCECLRYNWIILIHLQYLYTIIKSLLEEITTNVFDWNGICKIFNSLFLRQAVLKHLSRLYYQILYFRSVSQRIKCYKKGLFWLILIHIQHTAEH